MKHKCHLCPNKSYQSKNDYDAHMRKIHGITEMTPEETKVMTLGDCIKKEKK
jgi:hypothetical protein